MPRTMAAVSPVQFCGDDRHLECVSGFAEETVDRYKIIFAASRINSPGPDVDYFDSGGSGGVLLLTE